MTLTSKIRRRRFLHAMCAVPAVPLVGCARSHDPAGPRKEARTPVGADAGDAERDAGRPEAEAHADAPMDGRDAGLEAEPRDAGAADSAADAGPDAAARDVLRVTEPFTVLLADYSCTAHVHTASILPAEWETDEPINVHDDYHVVRFRPSELARLQRGERLSFATSGGAAAHGHCGLAWRSDEDPWEDYRRNRPADPPPECELDAEPACL